MLIYLLLVTVMLICLVAYILSKGDILSPPVVFSGVFIISILVAIPNIDTWAFCIGERTFFVILLGIISFVIGYFCIAIFKMNIKNKSLSGVYFKYDITSISNNKLIIFFMFQLITIFLLYQSVSDIAINMGGGNSLTEKIYLYRTNEIRNNSEYGSLPYLVLNMVLFCKVATYFFMYKFCEEYFVINKIKKIYLAIIFLNICMNFLKGNRGEAVDLIVSFCIMIYLFKLINNGWNKFLSIKKICVIGICLIIFLMMFSSIGLIILGRGGQFGDVDIITGIWKQISMYIGAPLKLLDLYMYTDFNTEILSPGIVTFRSIYAFLSRRFDIDEWQLPTSFGYEFRVDNGQDLGNVYTIFRPYLIDFGYLGVIVLPFIMGMIYALMYFSIKYSKYKYFQIVIYSYLYVCLAKAFFAEWFYKNLFNIDFIKFIIFFYIIKCFFEIKLPFKNLRNVLGSIKVYLSGL